MSHTPNELVEFFPEKADAIHALKVSDTHFAKLFDEYHEVNRAVHRGETDVEPMDEHRLLDLRKRRLKLLDALKPMIEAA